MPAIVRDCNAQNTSSDDSTLMTGVDIARYSCSHPRAQHRPDNLNISHKSCKGSTSPGVPRQVDWCEIMASTMGPMSSMLLERITRFLTSTKLGKSATQFQISRCIHRTWSSRVFRSSPRSRGGTKGVISTAFKTE